MANPEWTKRLKAEEPAGQDVDSPIGLKEFGQLHLAHPYANFLMEQLRKRIANQESLGVTVVGPYLTLRWNEGTGLAQMTFLLESATDSSRIEYHEIEQ